jgi:hypothetical protein
MNAWDPVEEAMVRVIQRHVFPHINLAIALAIMWGALALAVAVYDIGRWLAAW